ncbi:hypothetical protein AU476_38180 [Cupriavidus sp. UYMSc13B]|nr:hypothetical protein AU476_38180 [Cupriavidus sp. UYMSc13B]
MSNDILFSPFKLKGLNLPNCIVMAPMTRGLAEGGIPGPLNVQYYRRRVEGGVGLILTEGTVINRPASRNMPGIPLFHGEAALAGWANVADAVHSAGGRIGPQLWHTGSTRARGWEPDAPVESPSGLVGPGDPRGVAMTQTISVGSVGLDSYFFMAFGGQGSGAAALDSLHARIEREEFDLIAVGRALISDAHWVRKIGSGQAQELRGFDAADLATLA